MNSSSQLDVILLAQQHIYYLDPYALLQQRSDFLNKHQIVSEIDIFSILHQISIRRGIENVNHQNLWSSIQKSLQIYTLEQIKQYGNQYSNIIMTSDIYIQNKVTRIFLPQNVTQTGTFLSANDLSQEERELKLKLRISFLQEFLCLRALVLSQQRKRNIIDLAKKLHEEIESRYSEVVYEIFLFYLINFSMNLKIYKKLLENSIQIIVNLTTQAQKIKVCLIGATFRNFMSAFYLLKFGFSVTIYQNQVEDENYFNPLFLHGGQMNPVIKLFERQKIEFYDLNHFRVDLYIHQGKRVEMKQYQKEFFEILSSICQAPDDALLYDLFKDLLEKKLPRHTLIDESEKLKRSSIQFQFNKMMIQCPFSGSLSTVRQLKSYLSDINEHYLYQVTEGQSCYLLSKPFSYYLDANMMDKLKEKVTFKDLTKIRKIQLDENGIHIDNGKSGDRSDFDYLIYGENGEFLTSLVENREIFDNPGFEMNLLKQLQVFRQMKVEYITKILMVFSRQFWPKDQIFTIREGGDDGILFVDCSKARNDNSLLVIIKVKYSELVRNKKNYEITIKNLVFQTFPPPYPTQLLDFRCVGCDVFSTNQSALSDLVLHPLPNLFFNAQISDGTTNDILSKTIRNSFKIVSTILKSFIKSPKPVDAIPLSLQLPSETLKQDGQETHQNSKSSISCEPAKKLKGDPQIIPLTPKGFKIEYGEFYGYSHPLVLRYKNCELFELIEPFEFKLGSFILSYQNYFSSIVKLPSLTSGQLIHYYFVILKNNKYVLIPEDKQDVLLCHSNISVLHKYVIQPKDVTVNVSLPICHNISFKFPKICPKVLERLINETHMNKELPVFEMYHDSDFLSQLEVTTRSLFHTLMGWKIAIFRLLLTWNEIPQKLRDILNQPLVCGKYELKVQPNSQQRFIKVTRRFLGLQNKCYEDLTIDIIQNEKDLTYVLRQKDISIKYNNWSELNEDLIKKYKTIYENKFLLQSIQEMKLLDLKTIERFSKWDTLIDKIKGQSYQQTKKLTIINGKAIYSYTEPKNRQTSVIG